MGWRRDEIWFDMDVGWLREISVGPGDVAALRLPAVFDLAADELSLDVPNGLAESRQRRAELRRRRNVRRARAAALVVAPATMLPVAGQKLGIGPAGGVLAEDPPSLVRDPLVVGSARPATEPRVADGDPRRVDTSAQRAPQFPAVHWHRAISRGLPYAGSLAAGTQLPIEGPGWVTWHPVEDRVPNDASRLYGHERTIRSVVSVLAAYRAEHPGARRVLVGDISFRHGGPMEAHRSHQNGLDVDIYYPRVDGRKRAPRKRSQVDRRLAQALVDLFVAAGAQKIFVGYSLGLRGPAGVVVPYPNHEDHLHVRFPRPGG